MVATAYVTMSFMNMYDVCTHACRCGFSILDLSSIFFSFSRACEELIVFDLSDYDIYVNYDDDDSDLNYPTNY